MRALSRSRSARRKRRQGVQVYPQIRGALPVNSATIAKSEKPTFTNFKLDVDADGIALVIWDMPGRSMNVLDQKAIEELDAIVDQTVADAAVKGVVITSAKEAFSAGADITMLDAIARNFAEAVRAHGEEAATAA